LAQFAQHTKAATAFAYACPVRVTSRQSRADQQ
jgi:hypothetical protein